MSTDPNEHMNFVNLTPHTAEVLDASGELIKEVKPSGKVGLAIGEPAKIMNVPPPQSGVAYIVLPALTEASDRDDLLSIELDQAQRTRRGNVQAHICYWDGELAN